MLVGWIFMQTLTPVLMKLSSINSPIGVCRRDKNNMLLKLEFFFLINPSPVPLTLTPTLNYIFLFFPDPSPQGVVFGAITATNPYYCCAIEY